MLLFNASKKAKFGFQTSRPYFGKTLVKNETFFPRFTSKNFSSLTLEQTKDRAGISGPQVKFSSMLYKRLLKEGSVEIFEKEVVQYLKELEEVPELSSLTKFVANSELSVATKIDILEKYFKAPETDCFSKNFRSVIAGLVIEKKGKFMNQILSDFLKLAEAGRRNVNVSCILSEEPSSDILEKLKKTLQKKYFSPEDNIIINLKVDPSIVGGFILKLPQGYLDQSWKTKIDQKNVELRQKVGEMISKMRSENLKYLSGTK